MRNISINLKSTGEWFSMITRKRTLSCWHRRIFRSRPHQYYRNDSSAPQDVFSQHRARTWLTRLSWTFSSSRVGNDLNNPSSVYWKSKKKRKEGGREGRRAR